MGEACSTRLAECEHLTAIVKRHLGSHPNSLTRSVAAIQPRTHEDPANGSLGGYRDALVIDSYYAPMNCLDLDLMLPGCGYRARVTV